MKKGAEEEHRHKARVSQKFVTALSIVSIIGFAEIISETIFNYNMQFLGEALLMLIIGMGLIYEAQIKRLKSLQNGFNSNNITHLITVIIGVVAIIAGIFSFPGIRFESQAFMAVKGILGIIAIVIIFIQTWVVRIH